MRMLPRTAVLGPILLIGLIGALPAAGQSIQPIQSAASFKVAAVDDWKTERDIYVQNARGEVQEWQRKLNDFNENTRASKANMRIKASEADIKARKDFNAAWTEAENASRRLETVGAENWATAKLSFHRASQKLAAVWQKIKSQPK